MTTKAPTPLERWKWCYKVSGQLTAVEAAVLLRIASFEKSCWESHATIGAMIHYERRTVLEACKVLLRLGLIVLDGKGKSKPSNSYRVTMSLRTTGIKLKSLDLVVPTVEVEDENPTCRSGRQDVSFRTTAPVVQDDTRGEGRGVVRQVFTPTPLTTPRRAPATECVDCTGELERDRPDPSRCKECARERRRGERKVEA